MPIDFGQAAAQLVNNRRILFYGYNVVLCPHANNAPRITVDFKWNCYCINLPTASREEWLEWAEYGLESIYKGVICRDAKDNQGDASPQQ